MKVRLLLLATFAIVLAGAAVAGGTFLGRSLSASPPSSPRLAPQFQVAEGEFPINFQGILLTEDGDPVANSSHSVTFGIYDDSTVRAALWTETQTVFTLDGLFTVQLGVEDEIDPDLFSNNQETWLGIRIGNDPELTPRIKLAYSPYALYALTAGHLITPPPNARQVALLRWYEANTSGIRIALDEEPSAIAFDGEHLWIANRGDEDIPDDDAVTKIRAVDGKVVADFPVESDPVAVAFDGENIWVANRISNTLSKFRRDGSRRRSLPSANPVGSRPVAMAFDGENMWVVNQGNGKVVKYSVDDEEILDTIVVGSNPSAIAFDGEIIWVTHGGAKNVTRIRASDGEVLGAISAGEGQFAIAFDGQHMWVVNEGDNSVTKVRASDGEDLGTFRVGQRPVDVAFDGRAIWVANQNGNTVTKLRAADGEEIGKYSVGRTPSAIAFDGANVWIVNKDDNTVVMR